MLQASVCDSCTLDAFSLGQDCLGPTRERGVSVTHTRSQHMGRVHHVNLASLFRISPFVGLKNCYTRLQEGKIIYMEN
jgi:hypothetical protein